MLRVDRLPFYLILPVALYGYFFGTLLWLYLWLCRKTCKIQWINPPDFQSHSIYVTWHENLIPFFVLFPDFSRQAWLNHPAWFMKSVHVVLRFQGLAHLYLGSSGNDGRQALEQLTEKLKTGYSTSINPDGPAGPPYTLRKGALLLSGATGNPIVALRFEVNPPYRLKGWDRKKFPVPFSSITAQAMPPFHVTGNEENDRAALRNLLG